MNNKETYIQKFGKNFNTIDNLIVIGSKDIVPYLRYAIKNYGKNFVELYD